MSSCPTNSYLEAYVSGKEMDGSVQEHLKECDSCAARVRSLQEDKALMDELRSVRKLRPTPSQGIVVDGYELAAPIGHGSQGSVYRAIQRHTRRTVALKILLGGLFATPKQRTRFDREVELAARLRHPCIVTVFDSGTTRDGRHFLAMEFVEGKPLDQYLAGLGRPGIRDVVMLLRKICAGVEYAHVRGIIHRDLKPANVLIDQHGEPRIVDFGLAKVADAAATRAATMTQPGEFAGTFAYASPEQIRGNPDDLDARTDVYSLGVMLFEALTGVPPFDPKQSLPSLLKTIEFAEPLSPRSLSAEIDRDLETILLKALSKDLERRYQSAADLGRDLDHYLQGMPIDARRDSAMYVFRKTVRRHRWLFASTLALLILLIGVAVFMSLAYRRAFLAEKAAKARSEEVARLLTISNIESAKALTRAHSFAPAEELLWHEYLKERQAEPVESPVSPTRWAMRELYHQNRCAGIVRLEGERNYVSVIHPVTGAVSTVEAQKNVIYHRDGDQRLIRAIELDFVPRAMVYPDDGTFLIVAGTSGSLARIDSATGEILRTGQTDPSSECGLAISGDGRTIALSGSPAYVTLLRADTLEPLSRVDLNNSAALERILLDGDARHMVVSAIDGSIHFFNFQTGGHWTVQLSPGSPARSMQISSDGQRLVTLSDEARVWNTNDPSQITRLPISPSLGAVSALSFDQRLLAIAQGDNAIYRMALDDSNAPQIIGGHSSRVHWLQWGRGDQSLYSFDWQRNIVRRWDMNDDHQQIVHAKVPSTILAAAQIDERSFVLVNATHAVRVFVDGHETMTLVADQAIHTVARAADGTIAGGGIGGNIYLWNARGELLRTLKGHSRGINSMAFDLGRNRLISTAQDMAMRVWDLRSGECIRVIDDMHEALSDIRFSADGRYFAAGGKGSPEKLITRSEDTYIVRVWDAQTFAQAHVLKGHLSRVRTVAFTSDSRRLASASDDGTVRIWSLEDESVAATLRQPGGTTYGLCFGADDRLLAAVGTSGDVRIWNIDTASQLATFPRTDESLFGVHLDADSITTWGSSGTITTTDLHALDQRIDACRAFWSNQ